MHSFVVDIHKLLQAYRESISNGQVFDAVHHHHGNVMPRIVLRCGGTLLYRQEVCYVVIVTYEGDGIHDDKDFPPINPHDAKECDWSPLLDEDGCYKHKAEYPTFTPQHIKCKPDYFWDHVAFAIHIPKGKELSIPKVALVGGKPLKTEHGQLCQKYHESGDKSVDKCKKAEEKYKAR